MTQSRCYHCDEPILAQEQFFAIIDGTPRPMCCLGCQAVATAIDEAGLQSYYQYRAKPGVRQDQLIPAELAHYNAFDLEEVQQDFVHHDDSYNRVSLSIEGITCAACAWLIEHKLKYQSGIQSIQVNSTTERALVSWDPAKIKLSEILTLISKIGYQAAPFQVDQQEVRAQQQSRKFLLRLGLAGFATMQVMMLALALYAGYFTYLDDEYRDYFRWVSMIFAAPVVFYSAAPFYFSAFRAILTGHLNMDLSVSIAICGAYIASCIATINGTGEVYFESVTMFTFFLLLGRYFEQKARQRASINSSNLHKLTPHVAHKKTGESFEEVAAKSLVIGDIYLVKPGETVAVDGVVYMGHSSVNESMLTGEQHPVDKPIGCSVFAGTINIDHPIEVKVTATGQQQLVNEIIRLQEEASNNKPKIAYHVDTISNYFTWVILIISLITYIVWKIYWPEDAFWVTLSVLVATCPCALALATPTAITCSIGRFSRIGVIVRNANVFEVLPKLTQIVFDKTGTLTCGQINLASMTNYTHLDNNHDNKKFSDSTLRAIAAGLEQHSLHPISSAFKPYVDAKIYVTDTKNWVGKGLKGVMNGQDFAIGSAEFLVELGVDMNTVATNQTVDDNQASALKLPAVYLAQDRRLLAQFILTDRLRDDAKETVNRLKLMGYQLAIASGDSSAEVTSIAKQLNITDINQGMSADGKLELIKKKQQHDIVAMFGDGINDAPVLAGADLSVAMGSGAALTKSAADLILLGDELVRFTQAITLANKTSRIIKQNLYWALLYNLFIIPLAVTGHVAPYIAALGMSLSSLLVVTNSLRILRVHL